MVFHFGWKDREGGTVDGFGWAGWDAGTTGMGRIGHFMRGWDLEKGSILAGNTPASVRMEEMEHTTAVAWA